MVAGDKVKVTLNICEIDECRNHYLKVGSEATFVKFVTLYDGEIVAEFDGTDEEGDSSNQWLNSNEYEIIKIN